MGSSAPGELEEFRTAVVKLTNEMRTAHGVGVVTAHKDLNETAQKWAEKMAGERKLEHSPQEDKSRLGENIYWAKKWTSAEGVAKLTLDSFYAEKDNYDYASPGKPKAEGKIVGHFTQLVWRRCYEMGIGVALSKKKKDVYVCLNYSPPGNYDGGYAENVFKEGETPSPAPSIESVPEMVCRHHNLLRVKHGTPLLCINSLLSQQAQEWATALAKSQDFRANIASRHSSNIAIVSEFAPVRGVDSWYAQSALYDTTNPVHSDTTAAFTQLLWKDTKRIGVGLGIGRPWTCLVVFYDPKGNDPNALKLNVLPLTAAADKPETNKPDPPKPA